METPVKYNGPARVTIYDNNDVDVRLPRENEGLKLRFFSKMQTKGLTGSREKASLLANTNKITC